MACKLKCPACEMVLKEEGDECKVGGEYRVYDSLQNSENSAGAYRLIQCLECGNTGFTCEFDT